MNETCPGIELDDGSRSGCGGGWDCPECMGGAPPQVHRALEVLQDASGLAGCEHDAIQALVSELVRVTAALVRATADRVAALAGGVAR